MSIAKEPEQVMKFRGGSVLGKKTILKSDHFPGCQNKRLSPQIESAPNYRHVLIFVLFLSFFLRISLLLVMALWTGLNWSHHSMMSNSPSV